MNIATSPEKYMHQISATFHAYCHMNDLKNGNTTTCTFISSLCVLVAKTVWNSPKKLCKNHDREHLSQILLSNGKQMHQKN